MIPAESVSIDQSGDSCQVNLEDTLCTEFDLPKITGAGEPKVKINSVEDGWQHVEITWLVPKDTQQDDLAITFDLAFEPDFWWAPHLTPEPGYVIAQHVFRSPAAIAQQGPLTLVLVPDLDQVGRPAENPWYLDYDARQKRIWLGKSLTSIPDHVLFKKKPGMNIAPGEVTLSFYITAYRDINPVRNPWSKVSHFLWQRWAEPLFVQGEPLHTPMDKYVQHTYNWAFKDWKDSVWQQFELNGKQVGAPQFIVNYSQSPNYKGEWFQREFLSIWNQAWFSSLRSASGLYRYAKRTGNKNLQSKARMTKELALAAPMKEGVFPSVIRTDTYEEEINGEKYRRNKPWSEAWWTNSNRRPWDYGIGSDWYHILDSSWTCFLMLRWYDELEKDPRLLDYCTTYADKLISLQDDEGFFPGWLHPETLEPGPVMNQSPETSMSVTLLINLSQITDQKKYQDAALKAMEAVLGEIVPQGRWEDFETYWSCSGWGRQDYLGKKIERNRMYKQNNFSMYWTAEALLACYKSTKQQKWLDWGRRTLDELSMTQQVWQPPFIYVPALGGFGVMNADGEWNDSRETLFAELYLDYYKVTGDPHLFERGVAALRSGFIMMYCPENPKAKLQWEKRYPWFGPEDYGFTIENYGHGGTTSPDGGGIGPFTIYDWGNGAASEARNRIYDHYGDVYIDRERGCSFGLDGTTVERTKKVWKITDQIDCPRRIKIVFEDGSEKTVDLKGEATIR